MTRLPFLAQRPALPKRTVEMPELWKAWKAKDRLPPLSTSTLEISPQPGEIPTFPQFRLRGRMRKVENEKHVSHFPTAPNPLFITRTQHSGGLSPSARSALRARINHDTYELGNILT